MAIIHESGLSSEWLAATHLMQQRRNWLISGSSSTMKIPNFLLTTSLLAALLSATPSALANCDSTPGLNKFYSEGWGVDHANSRFQPASTLTIENVGKLELKWAYGLSNDKPRSYPLVTEDTIFIGDTGRGLLALDRETGCVRWELPMDGEIASGIIYEQRGDSTTLFFTLRMKGVYAVDAVTGKVKWHSVIEDEAVPFYSGTPLIANGTLYVPLSSLEIGLTMNPLYGCCTTSGGMAALDAETGEQQWYQPTISEEPKVTGRRWLFIEEWGPSGAPVWGPPTHDLNRGLIYFGTGQNYSHPTTDTSDAIFAVSSATGEVRWIRQFTENDAYNMGCAIKGHPNCPDPVGPDVDFGAPPLLVNLKGGEDLLIAGQKSGDVHALGPDTGDLIWSVPVGRGGMLGGVHWSMAYHSEEEILLVPISDIATGKSDKKPMSGMHALDVRTGKPRWQHLRDGRCPQRNCSPGLSAAIIANQDLVVAGSLDGMIEVYDVRDGSLLWSYDTWQKFTSVNKVETTGGAIDAHGPMLAGNQLIINSGYGSFGTRGGNALLVFELSGEEAP